MIYVMSDIHGEYEKYIKMLELIEFSDKDILYVIGDVIDRGPEPVKALRDMSVRANVYPILGNHEIMAREILGKLLCEITEENYAAAVDAELMEGMINWHYNGGEVTLNKFQELSTDERGYLLDYINDFAPYEAVSVNEKTYLLVHAGLGNFEPGKKIKDYTLEELAFLRPDYDVKYFGSDSVFIVCGHTPTQYISGKAEIYHSCNNICIDCGAFCGGRLACLCLDTMEEFYV